MHRRRHAPEPEQHARQQHGVQCAQAGPQWILEHHGEEEKETHRAHGRAPPERRATSPLHFGARLPEVVHRVEVVVVLLLRENGTNPKKKRGGLRDAPTPVGHVLAALSHRPAPLQIPPRVAHVHDTSYVAAFFRRNARLPKAHPPDLHDVRLNHV